MYNFEQPGGNPLDPVSDSTGIDLTPDRGNSNPGAEGGLEPTGTSEIDELNLCNTDGSDPTPDSDDNHSI